MKSNPRLVGLHVRLQQELSEIFDVAHRLQLPLVQTFFINERGSYVNLSLKTVRKFLKAKQNSNFAYFVHAAYWSNLTKKNSKEFASLQDEAVIARDLQADGLVIHVGAFRAGLSKQDQVSYVAESLNELLHQVDTLPLLLENGPHAGRNFGGDLLDFGLLFEQIEKKNRVRFCLDTAHAFVYGYNLANQKSFQDFLKILTDVIGMQNIALVHLNDTSQLCGSYMDKHEAAGDGLLGETVLKKIIDQDWCQNIPLVLELPSSCIDEHAVLVRVNSW